METQYNTRSPAVKRLYREAKELLNDRTAEYFAQPLDDNLFEWHFTVRGPPDSDFAGGVYHGRIILPTEYPMKPPSIIMLTPNGRFEVNKKICLSISGHHPESWQPSWSIRTALLAIIGFMPTEGLGAIGSLDYPSDERKSLASKSQNWCCPSCGLISRLLKSEDSNITESEANKEAKELAKQIRFKGTGSKLNDQESSPTSSETTNEEIKGEDKDLSPVSDESSVQSSDQNTVESEVHRRNVNQMHSNPTNANTTTNTNANTNANLHSSSSGSRFTTYLIAVLGLAIGLLVFRRLFLL